MGWIFTKPKTHLANFALCSLLGEVAHIDHRERKSRVILFAEYTYPSHSRGQNVQGKFLSWWRKAPCFSYYTKRQDYLGNRLLITGSTL